MWQWLIGLAFTLKLFYTLGLAVWSPPAPPQTALPIRPIVVCESSAGHIACFEVEAPMTSSPQSTRG